MKKERNRREIEETEEIKSIPSLPLPARKIHVADLAQL